MLKKNLIALILLSSLLKPVFAENIFEKQLDDLSKRNRIFLNTNLNFGYDYGSFLADLNNNLVLLDQQKIKLNDQFNNYIYVNQADVTLKADFLGFISSNFSTSVVSREFVDEPLKSVNSYNQFKDFLKNRRKNINNVWQRYGIIKDVNLEMLDPNTGGNITLGQQLVPFGYVLESSIFQPISNNPNITPMTEFINFNLKSATDTPYQNSTLTNIRDIGGTLHIKIPNSDLIFGLYNGSGPNSFEDNNQKDIFTRADYKLNDFNQFGISHWRGRRTYYRNIYSEIPIKEAYEMYKTGFHGKVGSEFFHFFGELTFSNDEFNEKLKAEQIGWYLGAKIKLFNIFTGTARFESFYDDNILINNDKSINYDIKRLVLSLEQKFNKNISVREEYSHNWELLSGKGFDQKTSSFGFSSVNMKFSF